MGVNISDITTQLGNLGGLLNSVNTYIGTTIPGGISDLAGHYASDFPQIIDGVWGVLSAFQSSPAGFISQLQNYFQNTIITEIDAEAPITSTSLSAALIQFIAEMTAGSYYFAPATVSSSVTAGGSNNGNGVVVVGLIGMNGRQLDLVFNETIAGQVTGDAQSGTATLNEEPISFAGQIAAPSSLSYLYPAGSGVTQSLTCINAMIGEGSGTSNYLNNGNFESWTGSVPTG